MLISPFVIKSANKIYYNVFGRIFHIDKTDALREISQERHSSEYNDHLVIIGYGTNGMNVAKAAKHANIQYVIIELNAETVMRERAKGEPIIYGDAVKSNILHTVNIQKARVAVIAISDPDATKRILVNVMNISTQVHTIIRTRSISEMEGYFKLGADEVIPEEFETSIEIFTRVLSKYLVPHDTIESFIKNIRKANYEMLRPLAETKIQTMGIDLPHMDIATLTVQQGKNEIVGRKLNESEIRKKFGITIVAIKRADKYLTEIEPDTYILQEDILYIFGNHDKIFQFNERIKL
jgi:CPA2 family monovalent cation:H+ antiporter-2